MGQFFLSYCDNLRFASDLFQDFEDWDDVGLNIPKPAELLQLYRESMKHSAGGTGDTRDWGGTVDLPSAREEEALLRITKMVGLF